MTHLRATLLWQKTDDEFLELISKLRKDKKAYKKAQLGAEKIAERFDSSAGAERLVEFIDR